MHTDEGYEIDKKKDNGISRLFLLHKIFKAFEVHSEQQNLSLQIKFLEIIVMNKVSEFNLKKQDITGNEHGIRRVLS